MVRDDSWYVSSGCLPPGMAEVEKWFTETRGMCFVREGLFQSTWALGLSQSVWTLIVTGRMRGELNTLF